MRLIPEQFKTPYISAHQVWEKADQFRLLYWPTGELPVEVEEISLAGWIAS